MELAELIAYVRAQRAGVVSTLGPDASPQAAYLAITASGRGELLFDAKPDSRKIANLRRDGRVAVVVGGADGTTLQAEGRADFPGAAELERCTAEYLDAFPEFAGSFEAGAVVLVRIVLDWATHGDFRGATPVMREVALGATPRRARRAPGTA
ncbi:pyridoxamine 5'-phosphate oxidase family protein [Agromyces soli]|uniref:Pyridoxamine 5'-phosphate oxidase family protein n=1 Tax=Agromyces soli TaxID=659012 RepID=A0ABY4ASZ4_9MICO|nr:pyridoxamine 5'-phosphate oxidase family protein [Agromyces soli]UOE26307.1 pyridoxamine 5'-phosphate oxidase family protein [Agromyces soli]